MATRDVFSEDELAQLRGFPEAARAELIRYFTLTPADEAFVRKFRGRDNVLGAAVQLCTLPWLGYVPDDVAAAPAAVVARLSDRLGIPVGELRGYGAREQTRTGHLREVAAYLGWRQVDGPRWKDLEEFLFARAMEHDSPKLLFRQACEYLFSSCLVRPGVVKILERVATVRDRAREETSVLLGAVLTEPRCAELDRLLLVDPVLGRARLSWLGTGPVAATPGSVKGELEKLAYLRGMDADTLDLSVLPAERRRFLAGLGRRLTAQNLARREPPRLTSKIGSEEKLGRWLRTVCPVSVAIRLATARRRRRPGRPPGRYAFPAAPPGPACSSCRLRAAVLSLPSPDVFADRLYETALLQAGRLAGAFPGVSPGGPQTDTGNPVRIFSRHCPNPRTIDNLASLSCRGVRTSP